jgi:hypothetical protein
MQLHLRQIYLTTWPSTTLYCSVFSLQRRQGGSYGYLEYSSNDCERMAVFTSLTGQTRSSETGSTEGLIQPRKRAVAR